MPTQKKERKVRSANRKLEQLTLNEQRIKLLRKLSKFKGAISRNKTRYEAITPSKIQKNKDMEQTKADYKKKYEDAESKRLEVSTLLKEIDKNIKEAKKLKSEGKDTSHLNVKLPGKRGRPKKKEGDITYKTTITPGAPLVKNDFINDEWRQSMKMRFAIEKLQKDNKQVDDIMQKAKKAGTSVHGIDEEEYDRITKEINKLTKEREAFMNVIRKRVGKENIITKVAIVKETKEKKARGRPKIDKPIVEKQPRGRPKKPVVEKRPRGRPKKVIKPIEVIDTNQNFDEVIEEPVINRHKIAKKVVSKKLKTIVDEVIKNIPKKKVKRVRFIEEPKKAAVSKIENIPKKVKKVSKMKSIVDNAIEKHVKDYHA